MVAWRAAPSNKGMKQTKPGKLGASQLIPGVRRTWLGCKRIQRRWHACCGKRRCRQARRATHRGREFASRDSSRGLAWRTAPTASRGWAAQRELPLLTGLGRLNGSSHCPTGLTG